MSAETMLLIAQIATVAFLLGSLGIVIYRTVMQRVQKNKQAAAVSEGAPEVVSAIDAINEEIKDEAKEEIKEEIKGEAAGEAGVK